ncbi:uncharacterized protein CLUP02_10849 [Colletotrichum lupini]|uniref:Uncharacterized protein n=1 Tax=Colletotrichum lupini TaxID=145971 RepID=A0A9Q8SZ94_9PEZI|nr:uncharacterized protein CLUP02_10849 [Colletotrichum lupini]UQC85352.1 hypothetical protein CLUP02_10849 [Colletotrichum lupini]
MCNFSSRVNQHLQWTNVPSDTNKTFAPVSRLDTAAPPRRRGTLVSVNDVEQGPRPLIPGSGGPVCSTRWAAAPSHPSSQSTIAFAMTPHLSHLVVTFPSCSHSHPPKLLAFAVSITSPRTFAAQQTTWVLALHLRGDQAHIKDGLIEKPVLGDLPLSGSPCTLASATPKALKRPPFWTSCIGWVIGPQQRRTQQNRSTHYCTRPGPNNNLLRYTFHSSAATTRDSHLRSDERRAAYFCRETGYENPTFNVHSLPLLPPLPEIYILYEGHSNSTVATATQQHHCPHPSRYASRASSTTHLSPSVSGYSVVRLSPSHYIPESHHSAVVELSLHATYCPNRESARSLIPRRPSTAYESTSASPHTDALRSPLLSPFGFDAAGDYPNDLRSNAESISNFTPIVRGLSTVIPVRWWSSKDNSSVSTVFAYWGRIETQAGSLPLLDSVDLSHSVLSGRNSKWPHLAITEDPRRFSLLLTISTWPLTPTCELVTVQSGGAKQRYMAPSNPRTRLRLAPQASAPSVLDRMKFANATAAAATLSHQRQKPLLTREIIQRWRRAAHRVRKLRSSVASVQKWRHIALKGPPNVTLRRVGFSLQAAGQLANPPIKKRRSQGPPSPVGITPVDLCKETTAQLFSAIDSGFAELQIGRWGGP